MPVTTSQVIKCADDHFEGLHKKECSSIVEKSFSMAIDYDDDSYGGLFFASCSGECHGEDTFFNDDTKTVQFKKYQNGDVVVKFNEGVAKWTMLMPAEDNYISGVKMVDVGNSIFCTSNNWCDDLSLLTMCDYGCCGVESVMYECYKDSASLNSGLDEEMKAIADKFFMSAIAQPPESFDPTWEWKTAAPKQGE